MCSAQNLPAPAHPWRWQAHGDKAELRFLGSWTPPKGAFQALSAVAFPALGAAFCQLFLSVLLNSCLFSLFTLSVHGGGSEMLTVSPPASTQPQELWCFSGASAQLCPAAGLCPGKPNPALSSEPGCFSSSAPRAVQGSAPVSQYFGRVITAQYKSHPMAQEVAVL